MLSLLLSRFSRVWLCATPWTVAHQAPLFMRFSRQEYWSGLPCPPSGELPNLGIEPMSLMSPVLAGRLFTTSTNREVTANWRLRLLEEMGPLKDVWKSAQDVGVMVLQETADNRVSGLCGFMQFPPSKVTQLIPFMCSTVPCLVQKDGECLSTGRKR